MLNSVLSLFPVICICICPSIVRCLFPRHQEDCSERVVVPLVLLCLKQLTLSNNFRDTPEEILRLKVFSICFFLHPLRRTTNNTFVSSTKQQTQECKQRGKI